MHMYCMYNHMHVHCAPHNPHTAYIKAVGPVKMDSCELFTIAAHTHVSHVQSCEYNGERDGVRGGGRERGREGKREGEGEGEGERERTNLFKSLFKMVGD